MYSAITDSFNASNVSTVASLPKFPSEEPSKKDLDDWLDVAGAVLTRAGYGSAMRDETPPHLIHLSHSKDMAPITPLTATEEATAGALEAAKHKQLCAKQDRDIDVARLAYFAGLREYLNKLAALIDASLRPNAGLRLRHLLSMAKHPTAGEVYDGGKMWRALADLRNVATRLEDVRAHDRAVELARDTALPDGCSASAFMDKINGLVRDHLPWLERPIEGEALGKFIIKSMPNCNLAEGRALLREVSTAELRDTTTVISRCTEIVRESATAPADAGLTVAAALALAEAQPSMRPLVEALRAANLSAASIG